METFLVKIFAIALALSQVTTAPDAMKTRFDRAQDREQVSRLLHAGCTHMQKVFDIEGINLDDLIATALDDPQATVNENKGFRGINFVDLQGAYRQFCADQKVVVEAVDLGDVIDFYNKAAADLPDHTKLKGLKLPGASVLLDGAGQPFAEVFEENQRRTWVALADIPMPVPRAFIAAEDRRFYQHKGIDQRGLIRAFVSNLARAGRSQGGSTITQQMVKNLLVGDDLAYERKIREIIVAARVERTLSKAEILELYLNSVYFGRGSWGIEMAARAYFGKPVNALTLEEGALLAGLIKGPAEVQWTQLFAQANSRYQAPTLVMFSRATSSACGFAQSAMGPFYCPLDRKVYLDTSFFEDMQRRFGACDTGKACQFSQAYVIAHEIGHHVQNLLGILPRLQEMQQGMDRADANRLQVMAELQADCFAGVWANHSQQKWKFLDPGDVEAALQTASAIGDDRLQRRSQGYVVPDASRTAHRDSAFAGLAQGSSQGRSRAATRSMRHNFEGAQLAKAGRVGLEWDRCGSTTD